MKDLLRPILELTVVFPGLLLAYFPVRSYLKQSPAKLAAWVVPLLLGLCLGGGLLCYHFSLSTAFPLLFITLAAIFLYPCLDHHSMHIPSLLKLEYLSFYLPLQVLLLRAAYILLHPALWHYAGE